MQGIFGSARSSSKGVAARPVKPIISVWAESNGPLEKFEMGFSFGDDCPQPESAARLTGFPMTFSGRVLCMGLVAVTGEGHAAGKTTACIIVNGVAHREHKVEKLEGVRSAATIFANPLQLLINDVINFMPVRTDPRAVSYVVSCLIELDE